MTDSLTRLARQASDDLRASVASSPPPTNPSSGRRPHRTTPSRLTPVTALLVGVLVVVAGITVVLRHHDATPARSPKHPAGFRMINRPASGFSMIVPNTWADAAPQDGLGRSLTLYHAVDAPSGAGVTVQAQDIGTMHLDQQATLIVGNLNRLGISAVEQTADSSTGRPGFRIDWQYQGQNNCYILAANQRAYALFFHDTPQTVITTILKHFRTTPLPAPANLPQQTITALDVAYRVPSTWISQASSSQGDVLIVSNVGGVEGTARVESRSAPGITLEEATVDTIQTAHGEGGVEVTRTATQLAGQPAVRLDYRTTLRPTGVATPPGFRRVYLIQHGAAVISLRLAGPDTSLTQDLYDTIVRSFRLT